ncbi:MAG TPA: ATP-binding cassette domain-containing protein [Solirubrobacteraceae bacterium]|nr:ATP-binding cassette domain-containing protein [Solirubrobacteraceae bacterium]
MSDVIVELHDVFCVHRTGQGDAAALQGAELYASSGEVLCVLGPSGAGKSTLLRVIAGLQTPSAGTVRVVGRDIGRQAERARAAFRHRNLGLLGQSSETVLSPDLPVNQAIELPLTLRGQLDRRGREARATELLETVGLRDRGRALPHELSGGERQRVALCAAVAHRPALLLADEPTGELDQLNAEMILRLIRHLATTTSMTVIIATHDQETATCAARTVMISGGRLAEETTDGERMIVVGESGWMRLPAAQRASAGIGDRARAESIPDGVLVRSAGDSAPLPATAPVMLGVSDRLAPARVQLRTVGFGYGRERRVFDGLSHDFECGRMTVVSGRSGSGKSTLLRLIAGLDQPDAGELMIDGRPLAQLDREQMASLRRDRIGYMPQEPVAIALLSALENVVLALQIRGVGVDDAARRATGLLAALALSQRSRQFVSRLSAGETQRVALARALASGRGLIVLDEPTSRLDEANARVVAAVLARARQEGQTIICATHDPLLISAADDVLALD